MRYWQPENNDKPKIPDKIATVEEFKKSLMVSEEKAREIERTTVKQRTSPEWYSVRRYRPTASVFGEIFLHMSQTPPDKLVLRLLYPRDISTLAIVMGIKHEKVALNAYIKYQHENGHENLTVCPYGFLVCQDHPFLGCSPDGGVYDLLIATHSHGFVEIKCPFSYRDATVHEA